MDIQELEWGDMDWIDLAQDGDKYQALANAVTNIQVTLNAVNFLTSGGTVSLSGKSLLHGVSWLVSQVMCDTKSF